MKKYLLLSVFALLSNILPAQFTLEHTYLNSQFFGRRVLQLSGEKYFTSDPAVSVLYLYNYDHTIWKSMQLAIPLNSTLTSLSDISETIINNDTLVEVAYAYTESGGTYGARIMNESGVVLLTVTGCDYINVSTINGVTKVIARILSSNTTNVYAVPAMTLEHTYNSDEVQRINMDVSGEKYFYPDRNTNQCLIYNSNHTVWKTINTPVGTGGSLWYFFTLSENKLNADNLTELIYSYTDGVNYTTKIINENGTVLTTIANASYAFISELPGTALKIIAPDAAATSVYSVPSFALEHTYPTWAYRVVLENSGEKYYYTDAATNEMKLFDAGHSLWKTVSLPVTAGYTILTGNTFVSEHKFNTDNLLEVNYSYYSGTMYESKVVDENSSVIQTFPGSFLLLVSELAGLPNKLLAYYNTPLKREVYSLPTTTSSVNEINAGDELLTVFPNPSAGVFNIKLNDQFADNYKFEILDISGRKVADLSGKRFLLDQVDLRFLQKGVYFLRCVSPEKTITGKILIQ
jgi:hypothetical protein